MVASELVEIAMELVSAACNSSGGFARKPPAAESQAEPFSVERA
jgi:hypothetical protein